VTDPRALAEDLASPDVGRRAAAAAQFYRVGCDLVVELFDQWKKDPQFAVLVTGEPIVGIAVPPDLFARIRQEMGIARFSDVPEEQSTAEFELEAEGILLDILTPVDGNGAIQSFLDRFGPGIQQVELAVSDVDAAAKVVAERFGHAPVYPEPRLGANGSRVNFFLVEKPGGGKVLIELFEAKR
jgi:hypothetical protein